jgi:hypothetical protein
VIYRYVFPIAPYQVVDLYHVASSGINPEVYPSMNE